MEHEQKVEYAPMRRIRGANDEVQEFLASYAALFSPGADVLEVGPGAGYALRCLC